MKYRQITSGEGYAIAALKKQKLSIRAIAAQIGRSPATVSRELRRNLSTAGSLLAGQGALLRRRQKA